MVDPSRLDELAKRLAEMVPEQVAGRAREVREEMERNFRGLLAGAIERMDLVSREEFEAQAELLRRTEEKLAALADRLAALEGGGPAV